MRLETCHTHGMEARTYVVQCIALYKFWLEEMVTSIRVNQDEERQRLSGRGWTRRGEFVTFHVMELRRYDRPDLD